DPGEFGTGYYNGAVFVVSGTELLRDRGIVDLSSIDLFNGLVIQGRTESRIGNDVSPVGDFNADGYADFVFGSRGGYAGYIFLGGPDMNQPITISDANDRR